MYSVYDIMNDSLSDKDTYDIPDPLLDVNKFVISGNEKRDTIYYVLCMFPYPSGAGMHIGHALNYTAGDILARYKRMQGYKVLFPIGWDAFGLPTENYALKMNQSASEVTQKNIYNFQKQSLLMNWSYDWSREINTTNPDYYKWTQRLFIQLYKRGLVYKKESYVNWDPIEQTVLANDQILPDGTAERSGAQVVQKKHPQWFIKITDYADRLLSDLDQLDWPQDTKNTQREWIGKNTGMNICFPLKDMITSMDIFTSNPESLSGVNAILVSPEYEGILDIVPDTYKDSISLYIHEGLKKPLSERRKLESKEGRFTGVYAINPLTGEEIPVWISDFLFSKNGSDVIMLTPNSIQEHLLLSELFGIPNYHVTTDVMDNDSKSQFLASLEKKGIGHKETVFNLKDWSVSRQRYRGCPIPIYYDENNIPILVDEKDLPVTLPTDLLPENPSGISPLAAYKKFATYDKDGQSYTRECDTLDSFIDSTFYYLRFLDAHNDKHLIDENISKIVSDVDVYIGGKEHTVGHLIYARFIHKFLYDQGIVFTQEPFKKLFHQGMILSEDGRKMSKRLNNIVNPIDVIKEYSTDELRLALMFMGPLEKNKNWNKDSFKGVSSFLMKVKKLSGNVVTNVEPDEHILSVLHVAVKKIGYDIEKLKFNTAIAQLMMLLNVLNTGEPLPQQIFLDFLSLIYPFAPEFVEAMANDMGTSLQKICQWPSFDSAMEAAEKKSATIVVSINGKKKKSLVLPNNVTEQEILQQLEQDPTFSGLFTDVEKIKRVVFIKGKLINLVI